MRLAILILASVLTTNGSNAADFRTSESKEGKIIVYLDGDVSSGDSDRFIAIVRTANAANKLVSGIRLNSPGGLVSEAVQLSTAIANAKIATVVPNKKICASACFLIFAAGYEKYASFSAQIGVHGASDNRGNETIASAATTVGMARRAKELGVPPTILGKMVTTPPEKMIWLAPDELRSMGVTLTGKPEQSASPSVGPQLAPAADASTSSNTNDPEKLWSMVVDKATSFSAEQNGGKPKMVRSCQPELKLCHMSVWYKNNDGMDTMVKVSLSQQRK